MRLTGLMLVLIPSGIAFGQGCVCQRQSPCGYTGSSDSTYLNRGDWLFSVTYQNFTSDRHYQGTSFIPALTDRGPNNVQNQFNISAVYAVTRRLNISLDVPVLTSSYTLHRAPPGSPAGTAPVYDATHSSGLADISMRASYWLKSTSQAKQNLALSAGLQMPTGKAGLTDTIYGRTVPEDVSVQLGSKSWSPTAGVRGFRNFGLVTVYGSGVYLFNPRGTTHVATFFGSLSNPNNKQVDSSTDQFLFQTGVAARPWRHSKRWPVPTVSYRVAGIPINDVFGPSNGFRRPANLQYIEPGFSWQMGPQTVSFSTSILTHVNIKPTPANPNVTDATVPKYIFTMAFSRRVNGHRSE